MLIGISFVLLACMVEMDVTSVSSAGKLEIVDFKAVSKLLV